MRWLLVLLVFCATPAWGENPSREAGKHFQRGVDLYNDGDFRGALVEFKKAYETWPRANVLYDIGQTQFQLMDYAAALMTMSRYLAETGPTAAHRTEVEGTVEVLRGRVGKILLASESGCEVTVDDQAAGSTPLAQPLLVSVGLRRVTVTCAGRPATTRTAEVSAGERLELEIRVPAPLFSRAPAQAARPVERSSRGGMIAGWTSTGLLLAATIAVGSATLVQDNRLGSLKSSYPVMRDTLDRQANLVSGLSIASDVLGACALVAAGVSTYLTVKYKRETKLRLAWAF